MRTEGRCRQCKRPVALEWAQCAWCGAERRPAAAAESTRLGARVAHGALLLQLLVLVGTAVAMFVVWGLHGWSLEMARTIALLWTVVIAFAGVLVWINASICRQMRGGAAWEQRPTP